MFFTFCCGYAQFDEPATFSVKQERISENKLLIIFHGNIDQGWHVYSTNIAGGGPTPATFNVDKSKGIKLNGKLRAKGNEKHKHDDIFGMEVSYFENTCSFEQELIITDKEYSLEGYLEYGACSDKNCTPPTAVEVSVKGEDGPTASQDEQQTTDEANSEDTTISKADTISQTTITGTKDIDDNLWSDVSNQLKQLNNQERGNSTLLWLFVMGLLGGLLALLTPCVWPIIPMTVSFFLKRAEKKSRGIRDAIIYGLSIIVIYVTLGIIITLIFGANALNSLSTNSIVNIFFCLLLIIFGISFLGVFEITLPSSWSNKTDEKARNTTGFLSIFIMAFTLALVSFSCTGPIIGFMLVEVASTGNILGPCIGMLGFSIALALPFSLFAMFPTLLKKAPKSGSWMNTTKVALGFVEIAFALKFLSVADLAYGWSILDRDTFLIIWTILSLTLSLYMFGFIKLPIDGGRKQKHSTYKFILAIASLLFAVYMIPGIFGKPLPAISAFAPPMYTQHIRVIKSQNTEPAFRDYEEGMAFAKKHNKPVLLDFTGYGCVNCREMEQKVWNDPEVSNILKHNVVLISLYVDDRTPLSEHIKISNNGKTTTLRTKGDKWSYLQRVRFGANAQPFYVLCSPDGKPLQPSYGFDTDPQHFVKFLKKGL